MSANLTKFLIFLLSEKFFFGFFHFLIYGLFPIVILFSLIFSHQKINF